MQFRRFADSNAEALFWCVLFIIMITLRGNMRLAKALKKSKRGILSRWKRHIVVNSMQARLRAQLGDRSEYSGERRRRSVVVVCIVLTITDPLRGSYSFWYYLQAALIRSCGASFACMELTMISRFQRLQASTKSFTSFTICFFFSVFAFMVQHIRF